MRKTWGTLFGLDYGEDIRKNLWLSETSAREGADKKILLGKNTVTMVIPPNSYQGLTIRLKGFGKELDFDWRTPFILRKNGNALVKLFVYPDAITPKYGSFEMLSTEDMALEGWVYRKFDDVIHKLGKSSFHTHPIQANVIADSFNERGWTSIFYLLVRHLNLAHLIIELKASASITLPGCCEKIATVQNYLSTPTTAIVPNNNKNVTYTYTITINEQFLDNPFSIAAILAHELCHVVYSEKIDDTPATVGNVIKSEKATLEEERAVDLLVFMFKLGEFQLRVARDKRLTLGYFNQDVFERIQIIVSRKLNTF
jgi:hypothetical protein